MPTYTFTYNGTPTSTSARELPRPDLVERVKQDYGYLGSLMDVPELAGILVTAAIEGWDEARLQGALSQTEWWKSRSEATRQWDILERADPSTAESRVVAATGQVTAIAGRQGIQVSPERARAIAKDSLRFGWDADANQLNQAVVAEFRFDPTQPVTGRTGTIVDQLRQVSRRFAVGLGDAEMTEWVTKIVRGEESIESFEVFARNRFDYTPGQAVEGTGIATTIDKLRTQASQFLVPLSDPTLEAWVEGIVKGERDPNAFNAYLKEQAKSLFPSLSSAIDAGMTVRQYADPYIELAAQELDLNPNAVDLTDAKWSKPFYQLTDPSTGERGVMSLDEWRNELRRNPVYGWSTTKKANDMAYDMAYGLSRLFGEVA